jgi:hypothetical protein
MGNLVEDYRNVANNNEQLFRNILKDLKRSCGICPTDFNSEEPMDELFERYSSGDRYRKFTICDFVVGPNKGGLVKLTDREVLIDVEILFARPLGYSLIYKVLDSDSIEFKRRANVRMS